MTRRKSHVVTLLATLIVALAGASAALAAGAGGGATVNAAAAPQVSDAVVSASGVDVAITVFKPEGASAETPVPVVLHGHGWGGSRAKALGDYAVVDALVARGFGVVSVDARGHGDTGGEAQVMHKDYELHDYVAVLDYVHDELDWVEKEPGSGVAKDVVAGAVGYSYGGAYQLLLASHDDRLDAIAPEMTWNDIGHSLAPNGVAKSVWVHALYASGKANVNMAPQIDAWYREIMATNQVPQAALEHFAGSNVVPASVDADVLLMQGWPDVLFNANEAIRTYGALEAAGAGDVRLFTYLGGHVLPYAQPIGAGAERLTSPCGDLVELQAAWLDHKLDGADDPAVPEVSVALENGECLELDALPAFTETVEFAALAAPQAAGSVMVPLVTVEEGGTAVVAGVPHVSARVTTATEAIMHFSLVVVGPEGKAHVVDDQSTPARLSPGEPLELDLAGVATRLGGGDALFLRVDGANEWFATNGNRVPGAALLEDVAVTFPYDETL